jgi:DNA-binding SARP family transcriptional activator
MKRQNQLGIITLGNFDVLKNRQSLTERYNNSLKIWEIFKYFVTFREELILPERIIDSLWPDADYTDPKRSLRALIFRLRKIIDLKDSQESNSCIIYSNGCYKLETTDNIFIDIDEFDNLIHRAKDISTEDPDKAIDIYKKALSLYKGDYLSETHGYDWLMPTRNYYRRVFLQGVYDASELLNKQKRFDEILTICEIALKYELFEEKIHFRYVEALAALGKIKQARNHYEYVKEVFEREMGVKPSNAFNSLYRLLFGEISKAGLNVTSIADNLTEKYFYDGPVLVDTEFFRLLYRLEKRRSERYGQLTYLFVLTLGYPDKTLPPPSQLKAGTEELKHILLSNLRKGDVICQWNEAQFVLSLPGYSADRTKTAIERVKKKFAKSNTKLVLYARELNQLPDREKPDL